MPRYKKYTMKTRDQSQIQLLSDELFSTVLDGAEKSPRKRMNYNFHTAMEENPHRFLNVMCRGTFITPHRHLFPPKSESFIVLRGRLAFFIFNDEGDIIEMHALSDESGFAHGIDIAPGIWHTLAVLSDHAVCYEVKPGPYQLSDDKEFAEWAPREGSEESGNYLDKLLKSFQDA